MAQLQRKFTLNSLSLWKDEQEYKDAEARYEKLRLWFLLDLVAIGCGTLFVFLTGFFSMGRNSDAAFDSLVIACALWLTPVFLAYFGLYPKMKEAE